MNAKKFSAAMSELDTNMLMKLSTIKRKQKGPVGSSGGLWRLAYALWSMREFA